MNDEMVEALLYVGINGWMQDLPFIVPDHDRMVMRLRGKEQGTVLCVEMMLYTWRVSEYSEPLSYGRHWCFKTADELYVGLRHYLEVEEATEPDGWVRAVDFGEGVGAHDQHWTIRMRRAYYEDGERKIRVDDDDK